jgi:hypothetical protein
MLLESSKEFYDSRWQRKTANATDKAYRLLHSCIEQSRMQAHSVQVPHGMQLSRYIRLTPKGFKLLAKSHVRA